MDELKKVNWMSRTEIQDELESEGFAVFDDEPTEELRDALKDHRHFEGGIDEQ